MGLKKTTTGGDRPMQVDTEAIARLAATAIVEHIVDRTSSGLDVNDDPFVGYSKQYRDDKQRLGRNIDPPDMTMTGGMINAVQIVEVNEGPFGHEAVVGVGTGTSRQLRPPPKSRKRSQRKTKTTGGRSASHNVMAEAHNEGLGHLPKREFFGVSPSGQASIDRQVADGLPPLREG
jgi:hypothetical protein